MGHEVNRKRVQRLMRGKGLAAIAPGPHTSRPHPQHKVYPYLIFVERLWRTVKYEDIYLKGYADVQAVTLGLTEYLRFYNEERPHMALSNETPKKVYRTRLGGGALIVDKYGPAVTTPSQPAASGQRCSAAIEAVAIA